MYLETLEYCILEAVRINKYSEQILKAQPEEPQPPKLINLVTSSQKGLLDDMLQKRRTSVDIHSLAGHLMVP